jgi:hypothetical protein
MHGRKRDAREGKKGGRVWMLAFLEEGGEGKSTEYKQLLKRLREGTPITDNKMMVFKLEGENVEDEVGMVKEVMEAFNEWKRVLRRTYSKKGRKSRFRVPPLEVSINNGRQWKRVLAEVIDKVISDVMFAYVPEGGKHAEGASGYTSIDFIVPLKEEGEAVFNSTLTNIYNSGGTAISRYQSLGAELKAENIVFISRKQTTITDEEMIDAIHSITGIGPGFSASALPSTPPGTPPFVIQRGEGEGEGEGEEENDAAAAAAMSAIGGEGEGEEDNEWLWASTLSSPSKRLQALRLRPGRIEGVEKKRCVKCGKYTTPI